MAIKVRLKPSPEQIEEFHKNFGCVRKVYNLTLNEYNKLYEKDNSIKPTYTFLYNLMYIHIFLLIYHYIKPYP